MLGLVYLLSLGAVLAYLLSVWMVVHRMRRPPRRTYASAVARSIPGDPGECDPPREFREIEIALASSRGRRRVPAWDIVGDEPTGPIVVCSPGWGDSKISIVLRLRALAPWASRIIAWDPPGLGEAPGTCRQGTRPDIDDLVALTIESIGAGGSDPAGARPAVLFGWSLGAGMSIAAGVELEARGIAVGGVIAESPYRLAPTPAWNYIRLLGLPHRLNVPVSFWILGTVLGAGPRWRGFDRAQHAGKLHAPLLIVHGTIDEIAPIDDARAIARTAPNAKLIEIPGAGHNDLWTNEAHAKACEQAVREWVQTTQAPAAVSP